MNKAQPWLLCVAAGLLSAAAFDPWSVPFSMVAAVALLFAAIRQLRDSSWRSAALAGLLYGFVFFTPLIWWMRAVSSGAHVALVAAEAVMLAVIAVGLRRVAIHRWWPVLMPSVWVLGEWVRGSFPFTGFPWGRLVHTSIDTPLSAWVRLIGMTAASFLMALLATALLVGVLAGLEHRTTRALLAVGVLVATLGLGALLPSGPAGSGPDRRFALVQGGVPGEFLDWPRGEILQMHLDATDALADRVAAGDSPQPDIVLWPENATDIDPFDNSAVSDRIEELSADLAAPILVGGLFDGPSSDTVLNAGVVWDANGPGQMYVKRKPVPYGEYVPFRRSLGSVVPRIDRDIPRDMVAGDEPGSLLIGDTRVGDTICYDIAYDSVVRDLIDDDAQVLVVQTSNAAFSGTSQPEQQWDISRLRAIETGRSVLVPSTNGISGVIDAHGDVVERAPLSEPTVIETEVAMADGTTGAMRWGHVWEWLVVIAGVMGWVAAPWHARRGRTG